MHLAPWYRPEEYALIREIMEDGETLPLDFNEWEKKAESERATAKREGVNILSVFLDADEFFTFCKQKKISPTARPPQHSPVAEGRQATRWATKPHDEGKRPAAPHDEGSVLPQLAWPPLARGRRPKPRLMGTFGPLRMSKRPAGGPSLVGSELSQGQPQLVAWLRHGFTPPKS